MSEVQSSEEKKPLKITHYANIVEKHSAPGSQDVQFFNRNFLKREDGTVVGSLTEIKEDAESLSFQPKEEQLKDLDWKEVKSIE